MVNIRTRIATVDIAFSSSRNAALTVRRKLQYTTIFIKNPSLYITYTQAFYYQKTLFVCQYIAWIRNNFQTRFY